MNKRYQSWGRYPVVEQEVHKLYWRSDSLPPDLAGNGSMLAFGNGRSYGDVCLNDGGTLLDCRSLDRFIRFDIDSGVLRCEAGVLLSEILRLTVARGWFLPVTPGTQFVTVGGAIANDVHGKNHHRAGTFGCHLRCFELLRSDGSRLLCSTEDNTDVYRATIGGLGLTGIIVWAEIQMKPIQTAYIDREVIRFRSLSEFFALARESDQTHEYTVAWVDCLAQGESLGRGLFIRGNHAPNAAGEPPRRASKRLRFPVDPPVALVNRWTLRVFNTIYFRRQRCDRAASLVHFEPFFYPLDTMAAWNRIYGARGFFQYQCAVPADKAEDSIRGILERIARAGSGSFLAVLKLFGEVPSPGLLSFPMPGATLTLDFPNQGRKTLRLLDQLDEITRKAGGRVNPSKDARMHPGDFQRNYRHWETMKDYIDPHFSSTFWRRVAAKP